MIAVEREQIFREGGALYAYKAASDDHALQRALNEPTANPYSLIPWPSAVRLLPQLIERLSDHRGKRIVDVGAGTGSLTLALANAGFSVMAIDVDAGALSLLERAAREQSLNVQTQALDLLHDADLNALGDIFIMADVLYEQALAQAMVPICCDLIANSKTLCVISPPRRGRDQYVKEMSLKGIEVSFARPATERSTYEVSWWWS